MGARRRLRPAQAVRSLARALRGPLWFRVRGRSMVPTLEAGDMVVVLPCQVSDISPGALVVVRDPDGSGRALVKRMVRCTAVGLTVSADNRREGRDSRHFGPVPAHLVHGRVLLVWTRSGHFRRPDRSPP